MPAGGSPRSDACLAWHDPIGSDFILVVFFLRWRGLREDRPDLTPVWHGTAPEAQILFYTYSRWKIWSEICRQIENGVLKNGKQKPTIFSDICTTSGHMGKALAWEARPRILRNIWACLISKTEVRRRERVHVWQACDTRSCRFLEGNRNVCDV